MEQGYEKRLLGSPYKSPIKSVSPMKTPTKENYMDRYIPLRTNARWKNSASFELKNNVSRNLFQSHVSNQPDGSSNDSDASSQLINQNLSYPTFINEPNWNHSSDPAAVTNSGRNNASDATVLQESRGCDLLSALVSNELVESSLGGAFSPSVCDENNGILAARENNNMFSYKLCKESPGKLKTSPYTMSPVSEKSQRLLKFPQKHVRKIPRVPYKVLDAPELQDDFYLNLVDWSSQNILAVGLGTCVYLWNAFTCQVTRLCDVSTETDVISSVAWSKKGTHLAIGTYRGHVQIWDVTKSSCLRSLNGHIARVGALAWNADMLASGSRDRYILLRDTRASANSGGGPAGPVTTTLSSSVTPSTRNGGIFEREEMLVDDDFYDTNYYSSRINMGTNQSDPYSSTPMRNIDEAPSDQELTEDYMLDGDGIQRVVSRDNEAANSWVSSSPLRGSGNVPAITSNNNNISPTQRYFADDYMPSTNSTSNAPLFVLPGFRGVNLSNAANTNNTLVGNNVLQTSENGLDRSLSGLVRVLKDHRQEVCGLKWSPDSQYLASGGNDNRLLVWSQHTSSTGGPVLTYEEHVAAVKAIAWSPHQHGLLASGGGTADRCIRFWNTLTGQALRSVDTGSQVCNIAWSIHSNELVSTHGYSQHQILVWRYPSLTQLVKLTGHSYRVLYLAISPDGENIVTGAGDETLRFWNVFSKAKTAKLPPSSLNLFNGIR